MNTGSGSRYSARRFRLAFVAAGVFTCLSSVKATPVEIAAHRGGYDLFPENTCAAFRACEGIADRIEFDVRMTADGALVLLHDETVNRTAIGFGEITNVADLTLEQLKTLDVGTKFSPLFAGERIPTLAEALRSLPPGIPAMLHRKTGSAAAILSVLRSENALSNLCIASGDLTFLNDAYKMEPSLEFAYEGGGPINQHNVDVAKRLGIRTFLWERTSVTTDLVALVHSSDMRVAVAALRSELQKYVDLGVDRILSGDPKFAKLMVGVKPSSNAQLSQGLSAYWKFDDGLSNSLATSVDDVEDRSPLAFRLIDASTAWISAADARVGGALALDGTNDYLRGADLSFRASDTNQLTISMWVKLPGLPSDIPSDWATIFDTPSNACAIYLDRANRELRFKVADAVLQAARPGISETNLVPGAWHHVVGVFDGAASPVAGLAMIYLDGRLQDVHVGSDGSVGYGLTHAVRQGQMPVFGRNGSASLYYYAGAIDDVAIWNRALSPAEIRQIHSAGTNGVPLEKLVMTIWITGVYTDPLTSDMVMDVRVDHGSLTNQTLTVRSAVAATDPYTQRMDFHGRQGHKANFHVPRPSASLPPDSGPGDASIPNFFQVLCP